MALNLSFEEREVIERFLGEVKALSGMEEADVASLERLLCDSDVDSLDAHLIDPELRAEEGGIQGSDGENQNPASATDSAVDLRARIADMKVPEKIKLAIFGNLLCRTLLIADSNRLVRASVLKNPKLQLNEVESFVRNAQLAGEVLTEIARNNAFTRSYQVKLGLVRNPKTPQHISMHWLRHLRRAELRAIARSKEIPQAVVQATRKHLVKMEGGG